MLSVQKCTRNNYTKSYKGIGVLSAMTNIKAFLLSTILSAHTVASTVSIIVTREMQQDNSILTTTRAIEGQQMDLLWHQLSIIWSGLEPSGSFDLCFDSSWDLKPNGQLLETNNQFLKTNNVGHSYCKSLMVLEAQGEARLSLDVGIQNLKPDAISSSFFLGTVALKGEPEPQTSSEDNSLPGSFSGVQQSLKPPSHLDIDPGSYLSDPLDLNKKPSKFSLPDLDFSITLLPFVPYFTSDDSSVTLIIETDDGTISKYTLTHDEINTLSSAGKLLDSRALLAYLRSRSSALRYFREIWAQLHQALNANYEDDDLQGVQEKLISNLIAEANSIYIHTSPDTTGQIVSVPNILGAMQFPSGAQKGKGGSNVDQDTSGDQEKADHRGGSDQTTPDSSKLDRSSGDGGDEDSSQSTDDNGVTNKLDIRRILKQSGFSQHFIGREQEVIAGLYGFGQLTDSDLSGFRGLSAPPPVADDIIEILNYGDIQHRIRSLAVIRHLAKKSNRVFATSVLTHTPKVFKAKVSEEPQLFLSRELPQKIQRNRYLALILMATTEQGFYNRLQKKHLYNIQCLSASPYKLPLLGLLGYYLTLDFQQYQALLRHIQSTATHINLSDGLLRYFKIDSAESFIDQEESPVASLPKLSPSQRPVTEQERRRTAITLLTEKGINQETLNLFQTLNLLDKSCLDDLLSNNEDTITERVSTMSSQANYHVTQLEIAREALRQLNYSDEAIKCLEKNGNLKTGNCELLAKGMNLETAKANVQKYDECLVRFNAVLKSQGLKFPIHNGLKTTDEWENLDKLKQRQDEVKERRLDTLVSVLAEIAVEESFKEGSRSLIWKHEWNEEICQVVRKRLDQNDDHYDSVTGTCTQTSFEETVKKLVKFQAQKTLNKRWERQERINSGLESWCEYFMRILFGM